MSLMLHCGAEPASREVVAALPKSNFKSLGSRHNPFPFIDYIESVEKSIDRLGGIKITGEDYGLSHDGSRFFGLLDIETDFSDGLMEKYQMQKQIGMRSSTQKIFSAGLAFSTVCFICDNLAFSGDITLSRKHTTNIMSDLPELIDDSLHKLTKDMRLIEGRYDLYSEKSVSDKQAHDLVCKSLDLGRVHSDKKGQYVVASNKVAEVLKHWYENPNWKKRNAFSLFNCFTEETKDIQFQDQSKRTRNLHWLFDEFTGFNNVLAINADKEPVIIN